MELNEACEKAARYWLGATCRMHDGFGPWVWHATWDCHGEEVLMPIKLPDGKYLMMDKITKLASPWGADLLLNAADDKSWDRDGIRYWIAWEWNCSPSDLYSHRFQIFLCRVKLQSDENESCEEIASGEAKSDEKYNAIVYAFAKAADVLEGV